MYEHRLSEALFPSCGLLAIKENLQNVHAGIAGDRLLGSYFLPSR